MALHLLDAFWVPNQLFSVIGIDVNSYPHIYVNQLFARCKTNMGEDASQEPPAASRRCDLGPGSPSPSSAGASAPAIPSLTSLATRRAAVHAPVDALLTVTEFFPANIRRELLTNLPAVRLRALELAWKRDQGDTVDAASAANEESAGDDQDAGEWPFERESQDEWRSRWVAASVGSTLRTTANGANRKRNFRQLFWEHQCRMLLKARTNALDSTSESHNDSETTTSDAPATVTTMGDNPHLFAGVVLTLKVHGRELRETNTPLILSLYRLRRLEVHHPEQQKTNWPSLLQLVTDLPSLRELGFFHGKLTDVQLEQIRGTLTTTGTKISTFELVSVKIRPKGFRELVALVTEFEGLEQLRLTNTITDMDTQTLLDAAFRASNLNSVALEHNDLEDDAFQGLSTIQHPIALRQLRLGNNALTAPTLAAICNASLDGNLCLERLEITNNTEIRDSGIHALTPMLASAGSVAGLVHLDVRNCEFGLEGVMNLLLALRENRTLEHLNVSQNFFGTSFGDILADFLLSNESVTTLQADYVGLTDRGCTKRLCSAMRQNRALVSLSLGANRLRDSGASTLLRPLVERGSVKPFTLLDLSGNLLTVSGLEEMATILESSTVEPESRDRKRRRIDIETDAHRSTTTSQKTTDKVIHELNLLENDFAGDLDAPLATLRKFVDCVRTSSWAGKRNVYDDEV